MQVKKQKNGYKDLKAWFCKNFKLFEDEQTGELSWCYRTRPNEIFYNGKVTLHDKVMMRYPNIKNNTFLVQLRSAKKTTTNALKSWVQEQAKQVPKNNPFSALEKYVFAKGAYDFSIALEKHFLRAVGSVMDKIPNKQIFCLVSRKQNLGKSMFVQWLFPKELKNSCMGGLPYTKSKFDLMLATTFLCNIEEFDGIQKTGSPTLKRITSQDTATLFIPFKNEVEIKPRITSFFATRNYAKGFLTDETGDCRFIIYDLYKAIDWKGYMANLDPNKLWAWACAKYLQGKRGVLTAEEERANQDNNKKYAVTEKKKTGSFRYKKKTFWEKHKAKAGWGAVVTLLCTALSTFLSWIMRL